MSERRPPIDLDQLVRALPVAPSPALPLDPAALSAESQARVEAILEDQLAAHTKRAYRKALELWCLWYRLRYGHTLPLPVPVPVVQQFVIDFVPHRSGEDWSHALPESVDAWLVELRAKAKPGPWSLATVLARLAALGTAHRWQKLPPPTEAPEVTRLLESLKRQHAAAGIRQKQSDAITAEDLKKMLAVCDEDLRGLRDRALLAFAFASGGRRRSEVVAARVEDLARQADGSWLYAMRVSKTNPTGEVRADSRKPLTGLAAELLDQWLAASGIRFGPVWRRVVKGEATTPLSAGAVRGIVIARAKQAGIEGNITAHSLRSGFVTEAGKQEAPLPDVMAMTGHRSVQTLLRYYRPSELSRKKAGRLLG